MNKAKSFGLAAALGVFTFGLSGCGSSGAGDGEDAGKTALVSQVIVIPPAEAVTRGSVTAFRAEVLGEYSPSQTVGWSIDTANGRPRAGTFITTEGGILTVAEDEPLSALKVRAVSVFDATRAGTATVLVSDPGSEADDDPEDPAPLNRDKGPVYCTVIFESMGGSAVESQTLREGELLERPADPVLRGVFFGGWYQEAGLINPWNFETDPVWSTIHLYAKWIVRDYVVTFDSAGGTSIPALYVSPPGGTISAPPAPLWPVPDTNVVFVEWYQEGASTPWNFAADIVDTDITLVARWAVMYRVTFDSTGGSAVPSQSVRDGEKAVRPPDPEKYDMAATGTRYTFLGWYSDPELTCLWDFENDTVRADMTLWAKWEPLYRVTFDSTGGSAVLPQTVPAGGYAQRPAAPTRLHYIFAGWYSDPAFAHLWEFEDEPVTASMTLWVRWEPVYIVTFNSQGGPAVETQYVRPGEKVSKPDDPRRLGHTFDGSWFKEAAGVTAWNFKTETVMADMTLWATWTPIRTYLAAGGHHSLVQRDGKVWATGLNTSGQLGLGDVVTGGADTSFPSRNTFTRVPVSDVRAVATGFAHSLLLKEDGSVWASGDNTYGQLGTGGTADSVTLFTKVVDAPVAFISAGYAYSLVLKEDGTVWAAGDNSYGQFGNGSTTGSRTFTQVAEGAIAISAGYSHSLIIKEDGSVWASGDNSYGQFGIKNSLSTTVFVQVASPAFTAVAAGKQFSMLLNSSGEVWAAGKNEWGQCATTRSEKEEKWYNAGIWPINAITTGESHALCLLNGSVWATGSSNWGQLGSGYLGVPQAWWMVVVGDVKAIAAGGTADDPAGGAADDPAGGGHSLIMKNDGSVWSTGKNEHGQLGTGNNSNTLSFTQVTLP